MIPHINAPIDEHPVLPRPPWRWWDRAIVAGLVMAGAVGALAFLFFRSITLR